MKYCRSKDTRCDCMLLFGSTLFVLIMMLWTRPASESSGIAVWSFIFFAMLGYELLFTLYALWQHRKYVLSQMGISVAYFQKWTKRIPWSSVSDIGICNLHYNTKRGWETVIRIAVGPEFEGPSHGAGAWNKENYSIKYQYRIIIIDYSEAKLEEFKSVCPLPIRDYR